ncbi:sigma-70 family RNA polymerase sigma factor [soil metagenome]
MFDFGQMKEEKWQAFEAEAMPHLADLYRVAMWLVRNQTEAEDLVQETFIQALQSFHRYELGTNCKAWMTTILYHLNSKRKRKLGQMPMIGDAEEMLAGTLRFQPSVVPHITDREILNALKDMPKNFREVVILADVEDFAYREIAEILDVPIGTVMSRLHRGRKILRGELAGTAREYGIEVDLEVRENEM